MKSIRGICDFCGTEMKDEVDNRGMKYRLCPECGATQVDTLKKMPFPMGRNELGGLVVPMPGGADRDYQRRQEESKEQRRIQNRR